MGFQYASVSNSYISKTEKRTKTSYAELENKCLKVKESNLVKIDVLSGNADIKKYL